MNSTFSSVFATANRRTDIQIRKGGKEGRGRGMTNMKNEWSDPTPTPTADLPPSCRDEGDIHSEQPFGSNCDCGGGGVSWEVILGNIGRRQTLRVAYVAHRGPIDLSIV